MCAAAIATVCMPEQVYSYIGKPAVFVCLVLLAVITYKTKDYALQPTRRLVIFDGVSRWQQATVADELAEAPVWLLSRQSRHTPLGLYLHFCCSGQQDHYHWVGRTECSQKHYRRLSRAILHLQQASLPTH